MSAAFITFILDPKLWYLVSISLSLILVILNHRSAASARDQYSMIDIQGTYIDPDIHQMNFFVWSGFNQVKRRQQGLAGVESWSLDKSRKRYVINDGWNSTTANYAERVSDTIVIKNPAGTVIKRLYKVLPFSCVQCKLSDAESLMNNIIPDSNKVFPTYANFNNKYSLVRLAESERDLMIADLDRLRACARFRHDMIPVGADSNALIADSPLAVAKDGQTFYYIPPTNYSILLSNGVLEQQVTYDTIPYAFCGSM
jgi:hypothetical protein